MGVSKKKGLVSFIFSELAEYGLHAILVKYGMTELTMCFLFLALAVL
jgi:hypothetical protein